ncbi:MAG: MarC family protein [Pyrinomonadaceae bacterium]|nr:MarC family protein [Pyrinomonadaceae bacterium]
MSQKVIYDALMIWVTIEPVGSVLLFAAITSELSAAERRKIAVRATAYSAILLLGAIVVGQFILTAMKIQLISLEVAGGIILFLFGLQMIFGQASDVSRSSEAGQDLAVFPLAVPSIVGPESITAVVLLTDNHVYSIPTQAMTAGVMVGVLAVTCVLMLPAGPILRIIGKTGAALLERVMGMILAALSVEMVMGALGVVRWAPPTN